MRGMPNGVSHLFWDSCVFTAFLWNEQTAYDVNSIEQYLTESRDGRHRIYASSLVFAEVLPSSIAKPDIGSFSDFVDDFRGAIIIIDASPEVMQLLYVANRLEFKTRIQGWVSAGEVIICDRYRASSVAYGEAQGLDVRWLNDIQLHLPPAGALAGLPGGEVAALVVGKGGQGAGGFFGGTRHA